MKKESLGLRPDTNAGTIKTSKFIDSTSYIYNRNTHDKSVSVDMGEIQCMISVGTICSSENIEKLQQLISNNYHSLFDLEFVDEITTLSKEELISICNYHYKEDTFSGTEAIVLSSLYHFHIEEFRRDLISGRLNDILELCVSKDNNSGEYNLVVKLYPSNSTAKDPVTYTRDLLYLVLFNLYEQMNRHKYDYWKEYLYLHKVPIAKYVVWVLKSVFTYIVPIVSIVDYKVTIKADDSYTWFTQLKQLDSEYGFLGKSCGDNHVTFTFRPREEFLNSTINFPVQNEAPSDTNYTKRVIQCLYTLHKDMTLTYDITLVGKDMVDSIFSVQTDEEDDILPIFSRLADDEDVYLASYRILHDMLSYTQQHEQQKARARIESAEEVRTGQFRIISDISDADKIQCLTKEKTMEHAFDEVEVPSQDEMLFSFIKQELEKMGQTYSILDYITVILEYYEEDKNVIDEALAPLDKETSGKICKVIRKLKKLKLPPVYTLNNFYKEFYY